MYPLNRRLSLKNCATVFAVLSTPCCFMAWLMRTRALPVGASRRIPPSRICGDLQSKARSVVLPVPAPPIQTDSLDSASSFRMAAFSVLARSSDAVST